MMLSTKGRYAVMALVDMASCEDDKPVSLASISERQEIPLAYMEQIFAKLKKADLVSAVRGPGGGYKLVKPASHTMVSDIVLAAEEDIEITRCAKQDHGGCMAHKAMCLTHDLWEGMTQQIQVYLASISLEDICERRVKAKVPSKAAAQLQAAMQQ